jgi:hypothetical protein
VGCNKVVDVVDTNEIQNADPSKSSRFQAVYDADVDKFNQDYENDNTKRKTLGHIKLLTQYLVQNGENRQIHEIPPNKVHVGEGGISVGTSGLSFL